MTTVTQADKRFRVNWIDRGYEPREKPNPAFPEGKDLDCTIGPGQACKVSLPWPSRRLGYYVVVCKLCETNAIATTAGRPDDPRSIKITCKI